VDALAIMHEEVHRGWWDSALVDELEAFVAGAQQTPSRIEAVHGL
jgi:hypothetical protein